MSSRNIPRIFSKKYKEKKWKKKLIRNIHIPKDRQMIEELYILQDGKMEIKQEIPEDVLKKLKPLAKAIRKNKGMVTKWKAAILLVIAGIILVFTFFFKNKVLEIALETSLEKIFQADVEVTDPYLSLFKGKFGYESMAIQDKNDPGKNLLETGSSSLSISIPELTRNRFRIESMILENLQLNTSRESDDIDAGTKKAGESGQLLDLASLKDLTEDPAVKIESLIDEQKENLQTFKLIEDANKELDEFTARWEKTFNESQKDVQEITQKYSGIAAQGIPSIQSIEDAQAVAKEYEGYYKEINQKKNTVIKLQKQFQDEQENILNYKNNIEDAIDHDLEYLRGMMSLPGKAEMQDFVSDRIKEILRKKFEGFYEKAEKLMPLYEKLKNRQAESESEKKEYRRLPGRFILYPAPDSPKFLIEEAKLNGGDNDSGVFNVNLTGITSEPEKWPYPVLLDSRWKNNSADVTLEGFLDLKKQAPELFNIQFYSPENPVSWDEGISALGVESVHARLTYKGIGRSSNETEGVVISLDMMFSDIDVATTGRDDLVSQILTETVKDIKDLLVTARIQITNEGIQSIAVDSDIDEILKKKLGDLMKDLPRQGMDEAEAYLRKLAYDQLLDSEALNNALSALNMESLDQIRSLDDLQSALKGAEDQVTGQAEAMMKELQDKAAAEAARVKAEAQAEAEKALAAAAKAKAEAEAKAKAEAEEKIRMEAEKLKNQSNINIPGF